MGPAMTVVEEPNKRQRRLSLVVGLVGLPVLTVCVVLAVVLGMTSRRVSFELPSGLVVGAYHWEAPDPAENVYLSSPIPAGLSHARHTYRLIDSWRLRLGNTVHQIEVIRSR
jgi:hypothetical protein